MPIGESQDITLPVVGVTVGPTWATSINTALETLITSVETAVTPQGLNINSTLEFNNYQATELGAVGLENKTSSFTGASNIVKVYALNGELYFNDANGSAVKITSGGGLNAAALAGIGIDYGGSNPAQVGFTDSTSTYTFLENTAGALRALLDSGQILLRVSGTAGYAVKLTNPGTLTGDVTRTLLGANPASTSLLQISSAGAESATLSPSITGMTITESGIRHGALVTTRPAFDGITQAASATWTVDTTGKVTIGTGGSVVLPVYVPIGSRITAAQVRLEDNSLTLITVGLYKDAVLQGSAASSDASGAIQTIGPTGLTLTATAAELCYLLVSSLATNDLLYNVQITYDRTV